MRERPTLREARRQAGGFEKVREAHQTELAEDYVELIADLIAAHGEARAVDLARRLGVTNATVNKTVQRLMREGLVESRPYRAIFLTTRRAGAGGSRPRAPFAGARFPDRARRRPRNRGQRCRGHRAPRQPEDARRLSPLPRPRLIGPKGARRARLPRPAGDTRQILDHSRMDWHPQYMLGWSRRRPTLEQAADRVALRPTNPRHRHGHRA